MKVFGDLCGVFIEGKKVKEGKRETHAVHEAASFCYKQVIV